MSCITRGRQCITRVGGPAREESASRLIAGSDRIRKAEHVNPRAKPLMPIIQTIQEQQSLPDTAISD